MSLQESAVFDLSASGFAGVSWVSIIWLMIFSVCLTLAAVHGMVWFRERRERASLMFCLLAFSTAFIIAFDLSMMRAATPEIFGELLRWYHVPVWVAFGCTIGFLHYYLQAGRIGLGLAAFGLRTVTLVLNFLAPVNLNFREINALDRVPFLGDQVAVPQGVVNPLMTLGQFSLLLLLIYSINAAIGCYRKGRPRRAIAAGGSMALFIALSSWHTALVYYKVIEGPVIAGVFFLGIVAVMAHELSRDILRSVNLNRDLVRERALTNAIFNGLPGMVYVYSPDGRLLRWNKRVEEDSGYSAKELGAMKASDWVDPADMATMAREWQNAMENRIGRMELSLKLKEGRKVPYLMTGIRVDIDGQPHLVGMGLDMRRQKQMESELELQQRELSHMNRIATLGVLAASIAHELNQPLTAVKGNTEAAKRYLLSDSPDIKELREIMNDIDLANTRASEVVRGLRALMRKEPPKVERVDLHEVIDSVLLLVGGECKNRRIEIEKCFAPSLPAFQGDRVQLQQVVLNLLFNAMDALSEISPAPGRITISTGLVDASRIRMTVADNGPGVPQKHLEDIFLPFFTQNNKGMGMGLPICRSIIDAHGGTIRARTASQDGGGARLEVEIPLKQA